MGWWKKLIRDAGINSKIDEPVEKEKSIEDERREILAKEKEEATAAGEPWVAVLDTKVNPDNIRNGFFELDWNEYFVKDLRLNGYQGDSEEEIVDAWFKELCGNIAKEEGIASPESKMGAGYVNTKKLGDGKVEVS